MPTKNITPTYGYSARSQKYWQPEVNLIKQNNFASSYNSVGINMMASSPRKSDGTVSNNMYTSMVRIKLPEDDTIESISSISITIPVYRYSNSGTQAALAGSLRTTYSSNSNDTLTTFTSNAIGSQYTTTIVGSATSPVNVTFTFEGSLSPGSTYYLFIYALTTNTTYHVYGNVSKTSIEYTEKKYKVTIYKSDNSSVLVSENMSPNVPWDISYYLTSSDAQKDPTYSTTPFTITGNPNGGSFATGAISELSAQKEVITSYELKGWSTTKNSATATYTDSVTATSKDLNLYPVYSSTVGDPTYINNLISGLSDPYRNNTSQGSYTITYNANGGSVSTSSASAAITRSYTFKGWASTNNATSANAQASYTSETTVYAYWTHKDSTASITLPTPSRTGYTFVGWAESTSATSGVTGQYTPTKTTTLYAIWSADGSVKIYDESDNQFKTALVWVYHNGAWCNTIPWGYKGGAWKICSG